MQADILIIGAGPAGLSTALHLAQCAPRLIPHILVLEKARHPRQKLCAGGLVADAEVLLEGLGLDVREIPHVDANAAHFNFAGKGLTVSVRRRHTLRVIRRNEFDAWLAAKTRDTGVKIREEVTVKDVRPDTDGVTVTTAQGEFRAKVVVGADGSKGVVRRCVLPNAPIHSARALEVVTSSHPHLPSPYGKTHLRGPAAGTSQKSTGFGDGREGAAVFDFAPVAEHIAGYTWDFPTQIEGQPGRCWGIYDNNTLAYMPRPPLKATLAGEMARHGFELDRFELQGHPIRMYHPDSPLAVPRVLLVGDAAGADPLFGEGISLALGFGKVAARELARAFHTKDFSFQGYRYRVMWSALGQTLFARWLITQFLYSLHWAWFQRWFWRTWKPLILPMACLFVLNWGRRLK
jgi:menaquinone-9 beta-reductase